jgi:hypothetical protein
MTKITKYEYVFFRENIQDNVYDFYNSLYSVY